MAKFWYVVKPVVYTILGIAALVGIVLAMALWDWVFWLIICLFFTFLTLTIVMTSMVPAMEQRAAEYDRIVRNNEDHRR